MNISRNRLSDTENKYTFVLVASGDKEGGSGKIGEQD